MEVLLLMALNYWNISGKTKKCVFPFAVTCYRKNNEAKLLSYTYYAIVFTLKYFSLDNTMCVYKLCSVYSLEKLVDVCDFLILNSYSMVGWLALERPCRVSASPEVNTKKKYVKLQGLNLHHCICWLAMSFLWWNEWWSRYVFSKED